ncbi:MAG TPA: hypothetical protein VJP79_12125 [Nitrososphaera sp.]|nr:hypothetical protein [Nitrososphaera sp.]
MQSDESSCVLCGKPIVRGSKIAEEVNGTVYLFDSHDCVILLKKFTSVYGPDFCQILAS